MPSSIVTFLGSVGVSALSNLERAIAFLVPFGSNLILVGLNRARKKPQSGTAAVVSDSTFSVRQPASPWQIVFGQRRVGGILTFIFLGSDKKYLHMICTLAGHVSEEIGDIQLDDEVITSGMLDGSGVVTSGKFSHVIQLNHVDQTSATSYTTVSPVDSVQLVTQGPQDAASPLLDVSPSAPAVGQYKRSGNTFTFNVIDSTQGITINYTENFADPVCRIKKSLGAEAGQPFPDLVSESEGKWVDTDRQTGHTKVYIRFDTSLLQGSVPNITAVVKGLKLYDPRTTLTTWSANPALEVLAYLTNTEFGMGAALSETGSAEFIAAANTCDESVSLAAGGSELRYMGNGAFLTSERPVDIFQQLLVAMAGSLTQVSDTWRVFAGVYEAATLTLTEKDFAGPIQIEPMQPRDKWANGAKGVFCDPNSSWQPTDFPAQTPTTTYLAEDGGETIYADLDFTGFVTSSGQSQRLARIAVRQARSGLMVTASFKLTAWRSFTGHSVALTFAKYGWSAKEFTIVGSGFAVIDGNGGPALGVQLTLRETFSSIFSWSAEDVAQSTPPHSSLPNPFAVAAPGTPTVTETLYSTSGSAGVKSRATISWTAVVDPLIKSYEVSWKAVADDVYTIVPVPTGTSLDIDDLAAGLYLFAVRSCTTITKSVWSIYAVKELLGLTAPPSDPVGFSLTATNGFAIARWTLSPDLDVRIGGHAIIRHSPLTTGAAWEDGILISGTVDDPGLPGDTITSPPLPLKTGTYLLKFQDSSGNYSVNEASFVVTEGTLFTLTTAVTITEDAAFSGAKTDVVVNGSSLQMASVNLLIRTEEFNSAPWSIGNITITADATTAPDGTVTADKNAATTSASTTGPVQAITVATPAPSAYTYSLHVKRGSGDTDANTFGIFNNTTATSLYFVTVNLATKAIIGASGSFQGTVLVLDAANGFFRIVMTITGGFSAGDSIQVYAGFSGGAETAGEFAYIWGAQLEAGSTLSAYDKLVSTRVGNVIVATGSYLFNANPDDRSSVAARRFEATVQALSFDTGLTIDALLDLIDDWDSIDGSGAVNDCNAQLMASVSDDNVTYQPYVPFHVADFKARYSKFRMDFTSGNQTHNIAVSQLRVAIKT